MKYLKNKTLFLFIPILLALSFSSWAAGLTLRTEITGLPEPILKNVTTQLAVIQEMYGNNLTVNTIHHYFNDAPQHIEKAIQPFGYFRSTVKTTLSQQGSLWTAHFTIRLGPPIYITRVELHITGPGQDNPALEKLQQDFALKSGQIFQAETYDKAKQNLFETANNQGYLKATFEKDVIQIDLKKYTTVIIMHLNTGSRYYFGPITFQQHGFTDEFLRRFLPFRENEPFSSQKILTFQQNLSNSNYFRQINVIPDLDQPSSPEVPIHIELTPNKSQQYKVGFGYGTFTGPRLTLGTNLRHLTNTGHHLDVQLRLSPVLSGLTAQYIIPGSNPLTDQYSIGANIQRFLPKNGSSTSETLSLGHDKTIRDWKRTISLSYLRERYDIFADPSSHNSRLLFPSLNFSRIKTDNLVDTRFGSKVNFLIRGASAHVVSNTNFIQGEIKGAYIYSPTPNSRILVRGDVGYTVVKDLTILPLTVRFFAGGIDSVRGFGYSSIGPGRYLKVASLEYQHHIVGDWNGAVFYDAGTAADHFNAPLSKGVGIGIIYRSLIGPIKVYVAHRQTTPPIHKGFGIEFSIGSDL